MLKKERTQARHFESRWPVALAITSVVVLLALLPGRIRLWPAWVPYVWCFVVYVPIVAVGLTGGRPMWLRIERIITLLFFMTALGGTIANLANLIDAMAHRPEGITGLQLLGSSTAIWATFILTFSMLYWQVDRGGPEARVNRAGRQPDWFFPQEGNPVVPEGWQPVYVDYLSLAFQTATAFSTTDVVPLTSRAKMLMMLESTISLVTIIVIVSRAINILGG